MKDKPETKEEQAVPEPVAVDLAQQLEVESQREASKEHAQAEQKIAQDILPVEPAPDLQVASAIAASPLGPPGQPQPAPTKPGSILSELICPECGKGGWKNHQALVAHIRFGHRGFARAGGRARAAQTQSDNGQSAAPDFSDLTEPAPGRVLETGQPLAPKTPDYGQAAAMSFDMTTGILSRIFGPEWQPQNAEERGAVVGAIETYYRSIELPDIPPGYVLCFVIAAYAAPRLNAQPTKTKLQGFWLWFKSKFSRKRYVPITIVAKSAKDTP